MKIALAQMKISKNLEENFKKTLKMMEEASKKGAKIICFPEVQFYPFFPQYKNQDTTDYQIQIEDKIVKSLQKNAKN